MSARPAAAVIAFFSALTLVLTIPLSTHPASRALDLGADTRLFLWTLAWDVHALLEHPFSLFQANIFFPHPDTLAYSEHLLGNALLGAPWLVATDNPLLALNAVLLISCVGAGAGAYFLARRIGIGVAGALAAGVVFAFAPPRFFRLGQLHLASVLWMPLCLAFLHRYAGGGSLRHLLAACVFFTLQALCGGQLGLFLLLASVAFLLYAHVFGILRPRGKILVHLAIAGALLGVGNTPFLLPYLRVQHDTGLRRSLDEAREWSPNAASFLASPTHLQRAVLSLVPRLERRILEGARAYLFPGYLTLLLAVFSMRRERAASPPLEREQPPPSPRWLVLLDAALVVTALATVVLVATGGVRWHIGSLTISARGPGRSAWIFLALFVLRLAVARRTAFGFREPCHRFIHQVRAQLESRMGLAAGFYFLLVLLSLWISLGPPFGLYSAFHRLVPGFDFIRVPSRFTLLTLLGLSVLAGLGLDRWLARRPANYRTVLASAGIAMLVVEFASFPLPAPSYPLTLPPIDEWIAEKAQTTGPFAIVELPVPDPRDPARAARWHSTYMLHSRAHWQKLVNGYSGFTPPEQDALFRKLVNFPDEASLEALEQLEVSYAVMHRGAYRDEEWEGLQARLGLFGQRLGLEATKGEDRAYFLTRRKRTPTDRGS